MSDTPQLDYATEDDDGTRGLNIVRKGDVITISLKPTPWWLWALRLAFLVPGLSLIGLSAYTSNWLFLVLGLALLAGELIRPGRNLVELDIKPQGIRLVTRGLLKNHLLECTWPEISSVEAVLSNVNIWLQDQRLAMLQLRRMRNADKVERLLRWGRKTFHEKPPALPVEPVPQLDVLKGKVV